MKFSLHVKPVVRLTAWYVLIIMAISIMFSVVIYRQTAMQFRAGFISPRGGMMAQPDQRYAPLFNQGIIELFSERYDAVTSQLRVRLILINLIILVGAGIASYFLARRTLHPIEDALEEQRRFSADASHELRTPLTAMKTEIEVGLSAADPQEHCRILKSNLEEIEKLDRLSNSLLTLARHENIARQINLQPVNFAPISVAAIKRVNPKALKKAITIVSENMSGSVKGDQASLTDLLAIILDNAIKYSPSQSAINMIGDWSRTGLSFKVVDHGIGIPVTDLPHVFRRFYRADSARTKTGTNGFGLGLAIAKQIVDQHHGSIAIASEMGQGTTVTVNLPRS